MSNHLLEIAPGIFIHRDAIKFDYIRASGPGGQNVNKVSSAVQLRFDTRNPSIPEEVRCRLVKLAGQRIHEDGTLIIEASRFRTQEGNRQDALNRLANLLRKAAVPPKLRCKTQPTLESKRRRLEAKRHRSMIKRLRRDDSLES